LVVLLTLSTKELNIKERRYFINKNNLFAHLFNFV